MKHITIAAIIATSLMAPVLPAQSSMTETGQSEKSKNLEPFKDLVGNTYQWNTWKWVVTSPVQIEENGIALVTSITAVSADGKTVTFVACSGDTWTVKSTNGALIRTKVGKGGPDSFKQLTKASAKDKKAMLDVYTANKEAAKDKGGKPGKHPPSNGQPGSEAVIPRDAPSTILGTLNEQPAREIHWVAGGNGKTYVYVLREWHYATEDERRGGMGAPLYHPECNVYIGYCPRPGQEAKPDSQPDVQPESIPQQPAQSDSENSVFGRRVKKTEE